MIYYYYYYYYYRVDTGETVVTFGDWSGVVVMALVTSTKLSPFSTDTGDDLGWVCYPGVSVWHIVWVDAMSTGGGFSHRWGRNDEFCVAIGCATRTAGILAEVG